MSVEIANLAQMTENRMGRPPIYDPEIAAKLCERIAEGTRGLRKICADSDMPSVQTVFNWLFHKKDFLELYAQAKAAQSELGVDEIIDLADDCQLTMEQLQKVKLQIEARKWVAMKLKPKKYGDSTILRGDKENPIDIGLAALLDVAAQKRNALFSAPGSPAIEGESQRVIDVGISQAPDAQIVSSHEIPYSAPLEQSLAKAKPKTKSAKDFL